MSEVSRVAPLPPHSFGARRPPLGQGEVRRRAGPSYEMVSIEEGYRSVQWSAAVDFWGAAALEENSCTMLETVAFVAWRRTYFFGVGRQLDA